MKTMNNIKTVIVLATLVFSSLLTMSCSSDDDNQDPIVGTWLQVSELDELFLNDVPDGTFNQVVDANNFIRVTFNADGTFTELYSESFILNGQEVVETEAYSGTYTISGSTLTWIEEGYPDDPYIREFTLNGDTLSLIFTEGYTDQNNDVRRYVTTETYSRQ